MQLPRSSGVLCHISSLPSRFGIGDLGPAARTFVDFLARTEQRYWQVLPIGPVGYGASPYASPSTFAGNPAFISPELLVDDGLLSKTDLKEAPQLPHEHVDFQRAHAVKEELLRRAFKAFNNGKAPRLREPFSEYCAEETTWLESYALYTALKHAHDEVAWTDWAPAYAQREEDALRTFRASHGHELRYHKFNQFLFDRQWRKLRAYCHAQDVQIFGDLPIYVAHDSADVWSNQELFHLDEEGHATVVAGVPPDYFSETGQRWGNPLYRWERLRATDYDWWVRRLASVLRRMDVIRLDHFRAFAGYWEIPSHEPTAENGRWVEGPGAHFFQTVRNRLGDLPIVAEDLGIITDDVRDLMAQFDLPGMVVLQFAFGGGTDSIFLPHNYQKNVVAYTGTHDNDTLLGWWHAEDSTQDAEKVAAARAYATAYLDLEDADSPTTWPFIRSVMRSSANLALFPVQDLLQLDSSARMNTPGNSGENWAWRMKPGALTDAVADRLHQETRLFGRGTSTAPFT